MFHVIYEDEAILVVHKESGIPMQTAKAGQKDMVSLLKNYRVKKGEAPYIGIVHRLDQPVEGVCVFAKTSKAAAEISRQVAERRTEKYYYAVVYLPEGVQVHTGEHYRLVDYLLRDGKNNCSFVTEERTPGAKRAELSYVFLEQIERCALAKVKLETGRHHQIRVQLSHAGYPLVGDRKYGRGEAEAAAGKNHVALCSARIVFAHPYTMEKMEFSTKPFNPIFDKFFTRG